MNALPQQIKHLHNLDSAYALNYSSILIQQMVKQINKIEVSHAQSITDIITIISDIFINAKGPVLDDNQQLIFLKTMQKCLSLYKLYYKFSQQLSNNTVKEQHEQVNTQFSSEKQEEGASGSDKEASEDEKEIIEDDMDLIAELVSEVMITIGSFIKHHSQKFLQHINHYFSMVSIILKVEQKDPALTKGALYLLCDMIEYLPIENYYAKILEFKEHLLLYLKKNDIKPAHASAFALGLIAQRFPP